MKRINYISMIKNGTVAVLSMISVGILFGNENIMIAFPLALNSVVLSKQNIRIKTFSKGISLVIINVLIVVVAYISSINLYLGFFINFIAIFIIIFCTMSTYYAYSYRPFAMLFVFTQYAKVSIERLPNRILGVIFGSLIVILLNLIISKKKKSILGDKVDSTLKLLKKQIVYIIEGRVDNKITSKVSNILRGLAYEIYITRNKKYLTTHLGEIQFEIFISLEYFNILLRYVYNSYLHGEIEVKELEKIVFIIDYMLKYSTYSSDLDELKLRIENYKSENEISKKVKDNLFKLYESFKKITNIDKNNLYTINEELEKSYIDNNSNIFKEDFNDESIRFRYSMRMAITLSISLLVSENLGYYKVIWAIIPIVSIMYPYYEETKRRVKERVIGNVIGVIIVGIIIDIFHSKNLIIVILICSLYLIYAYNEYDKISLFTAIASVCIASLSSNVNVLIIYRIFYLVVGVIVVFTSNKYIYPYKIKNGISSIINKISKIYILLCKENIKYLNNSGRDSIIIDLVIHISLLCQELYVRNKEYGNEKVNELILIYTYLVIQQSYETLNKKSCS